ncbi:MAG: hypothetical protein OEL83_15860 [Desulforhopalus sp.]|nr:hypothetical protein [Desulforhopalus sp.]
MKRFVILLSFFIFFSTAGGCANKHEAPIEAVQAPAQPNAVAVLTVADKERQQLPPDDRIELTRVMNWLDRDLIDHMRSNGIETVLLDDIKNYTSAMGPLFIINVEFFNPGTTPSLPRGRMGIPVSALDLSYKLLDERGALLTEWQDGEHSLKGGTYCARTLNRRAVDKITKTLASR